MEWELVQVGFLIIISSLSICADSGSHNTKKKEKPFTFYRDHSALSTANDKLTNEILFSLFGSWHYDFSHS